MNSSPVQAVLLTPWNWAFLEKSPSLLYKRISQSFTERDGSLPCKIWSFHGGYLQEPHDVTSQKTVFFIVHSRVHRTCLLIIILSQCSPAHTAHPIFLGSVLILYYHMRLRFPSRIFPPSFPTHNFICIELCSHSCYITRHSHSPWSGHFNCTWCRSRVMKHLIRQISLSSYYLQCLWFSQRWLCRFLSLQI
jgi:hypothetical protein